jgi:uncharacterized membrane protein required for colicin V production
MPLEVVMNWLLIVIGIIILSNAFIGLKTGFIKTVFSLVSLVLALVLTIWISPVMKDFLKGNDKIYGGISHGIEKILPFGDEEVPSENQTSEIEKLKLPKSIKDSLIKNNTAQSYKTLVEKSFKGYISDYLTGIIINALAFSVTFIIIIILLSAICIALNLISKLPLLNSLNKTMGLLAGLAQGLIIVWLFFIVLTVFSSSPFGRDAMELVGESQILSILYNNNYLLGFITDATKTLF